MATLIGRIRRLVAGKGYGFVVDSQNVERFFHRSACRRVKFEHLREGDLVVIEPEDEGPKGPRCASVSRH